ncbi:sensor histidine kinase [Leptothermofonsia sp. ETS-13]|uniref:sensor histidine kinase n=1 Tax=Leptothermofonsia sp. ETS-13 TaxID=3035696 RepID=UPI003BA17C47
MIESLERRVGRSLEAFVKQLRCLTESPQGCPDWQPHLDSMQQEVSSLCDLIADAMLLQKLEAGKVSVRLESLDLYPLLESVSRHLINTKAGSTVRLVCEIDPRLPHVLADRELTEAVLTDLLARSMKYSDPGSPVVLAARSVAGKVFLQVTAQRFASPGDRDFATEVVLCCRQIEVQNGQVTCQHHPDGLQTVVITLPVAPATF